MLPEFLIDGPEDAAFTILLAHGAGAPMDSASMTAATKALAGAGFRIARFEFAYMAARRTSPSRRPPPKAELLIPEFQAAVAALSAKGQLIIGGKSMGGRVASMVAEAMHAQGQAAGLLCLGYPFHPPGKPEKLRTAHLEHLAMPTLICQGTRDEFGTFGDIGAYALSPAITILWLEDGDHDLKPRKSISGFTAEQHLASVGDAVREWAARLPRR